MASILPRWEADGGLRLVRLSRAPTARPGDDTTVCVNAGKVTDVRAVPAGLSAPPYRTSVRFGGVQALVTEEPDEVRRRLA